MKNYMKHLICIGIVLSLCSCKSSHQISSADLEKYSMNYNIEDNKYGVVIVEDGGISRREAREYGLQKASEVAKDNGYQYFVIDSEEQVEVLKGDNSNYQGQAPSNMYYELIQSDNFGRERFESENISTVRTLPGYQIEFSCFREKPSTKHAIDVCLYQNCSD